jgi:hypothetical protein
LIQARPHFAASHVRRCGHYANGGIEFWIKGRSAKWRLGVVFCAPAAGALGSFFSTSALGQMVWFMELGQTAPWRLGRCDEAIQEGLKAVDSGIARFCLIYYTSLTAFYAAADKMPEVKAALADAMNLNPKLSVAWFHAHNSAFVDTPPGFREALIKAWAARVMTAARRGQGGFPQLRRPPSRNSPSGAVVRSTLSHPSTIPGSVTNAPRACHLTCAQRESDRPRCHPPHTASSGTRSGLHQRSASFTTVALAASGSANLRMTSL